MSYPLLGIVFVVVAGVCILGFILAALNMTVDIETDEANDGDQDTK